jgi:sulfatase modifying factor 1
MVWVPGGLFSMGTDEEMAYPQERPAHRVRVSGFWMDETEVTNAQFARFVEATGHVTTAERKPDWEEIRKQVPPGTPKPSDDMLVPGSLVFTPPSRPVSLSDMTAWWTWTPGADWRHPEGPGSSTEGREEHPVVQVSWDDAVAYAKWSGKRLPTEAEWEFAARGGLRGKRYAWGDELQPRGKWVANAWQGDFPYENTAADGFAGTAPVRSFPPNQFALFDIIGNVAEWCADWYRVDAHRRQAERGIPTDPRGPGESFDPRDPYAPKRVVKGGSFLSGERYSITYRPSARQGMAPDTGNAETGFRCVMDAAAWQQEQKERGGAGGAG